MSGTWAKTVTDAPEKIFTLRRALLVLVLMFMLSFEPAINTQTLRVERTPIEYVVPARRNRRLRGRRHRRVPLRFASIESFLILQG
jgi:hypothetical protein